MSAEQLLLLEDDADQRQLLQFMLEDAGYQVTPCATVAAALQTLEAPGQAVQIVLSDWKLAGDGAIENGLVPVPSIGDDFPVMRLR